MPAHVGHGEHWRAALGEGDPRLRDAITVPVDAPEAIRLWRTPLTEALDMVQVTARRRLITAYPEPRATALVRLKPRELHLWETRVEGWLVAEHAGAGALTFFLTDLVERASEYERARGEIALEIAGLAYTMDPAREDAGPSRLKPAGKVDDRFLPDDLWYVGDVHGAHDAGEDDVVDLAFHGDLAFPVVTRHALGLKPGDRATGYLWLTARWPEDPGA